MATESDFRNEYASMDDHDLRWAFERLEIKLKLLHNAIQRDRREDVSGTPLGESVEMYCERYWACEKEVIDRGIYADL